MEAGPTVPILIDPKEELIVIQMKPTPTLTGNIDGGKNETVGLPNPLNNKNTNHFSMKNIMLFTYCPSNIPN